MKKIWVKIFYNNNQLYCYDVGTNNILQIDEVLGKVLEKYDYSNETEIFASLGNLYGKEPVKEALLTVHNFNKEMGGFILEREMILRFPFNKEDYYFIINNFLNHLILNITCDCNYRCSYCSYGNTYSYTRNHSYKTMPWEVIKGAIDFYLPRTTEYLKNTKKDIGIGFYGGESLLEKKNIFRAIEYIRGHYKDLFSKISFNMTSNGSLLDKNTIEKLMEYNFSLTISLDGPKNIHDRYRVFKNGGGTFDVIMNNLNLLKETYPDFFKTNVRFNAVINPPFKLLEIKEFFKINFPEMNLSAAPMNPFDTSFFKNFNMKKETEKFNHEIRMLRKQYIENKISGETAFESSLFDYFLFKLNNRDLYELPMEIYPNGICPPALKRIFVETDGTIHLCERINPEFNIGDIKNGFDMEKIFLYIDEYIKTTGNCNGCWAIRFCKDCFISAIKGDKFNQERKQFNCAIRKEKVMDEMMFYTEIMHQCPGIMNDIYYTSPEENIIQLGYNYLSKLRIGEKNE